MIQNGYLHIEGMKKNYDRTESFSHLQEEH